MKKINQIISRLKSKIPHFKIKKKDKSKEVAVVETSKLSNETKLKFAHEHRPKVIFHTKHRLTKALVFVVPLLIAGGGITLGILTRPNHNDIPVQVIVDENTNMYRVFLLSEDNMVVPVSLKTEDKISTDEKVLDVFNYLKDDRQYENGTIKGIIPADTKLTDIYVKDKILTLDFSEEFNAIKTDIARSVEALTYSFLNIEGIEGLSIRIDGCLVDKIGNYQIPTILNRSFGINKSTPKISDMDNGEEVVMIYNKKINGKQFYTPVSVFAKRGTSVADTIYNAIELNPNIIKGLSRVEEYSYLNIDKRPVVENQVVSLDVTQAAMIDEVTISRDLYDLMNLTFAYSNANYKVSLTFDGESYAVDGIINEDDYKVSAVVFNEVQL